MQYSFDSTAVEIQDYPPPFAAQGIPVQIVREESDDKGLVFYLRVLDGEHVGRELRDGLNFAGNEVAAKIAHQTLAQYGWVTGRPRFGATEELFNIPFRIDVAPDKTNTYANVKKRYDINGVQPWVKPKSNMIAFPQPAQPAQSAFTSPAFTPPPPAAAPQWAPAPQAVPAPQPTFPPPQPVFPPLSLSAATQQGPPQPAWVKK